MVHLVCFCFHIRRQASLVVALRECSCCWRWTASTLSGRRRGASWGPLRSLSTPRSGLCSRQRRALKVVLHPFHVQLFFHERLPVMRVLVGFVAACAWCVSGVRFWLASSIVRRRSAAWSGVSRCSAASPWSVGVASQRMHGAIFTWGSRCTSQSGEESSQDTRHAGRTPPPARRTPQSAEAALLATQQAFGRVVVQPVRSPDLTLLGTSSGRCTRSVAASRSRRKRPGDGPQYRLLRSRRTDSHPIVRQTNSRTPIRQSTRQPPKHPAHRHKHGHMKTRKESFTTANLHYQPPRRSL